MHGAALSTAAFLVVNLLYNEEQVEWGRREQLTLATEGGVRERRNGGSCGGRLLGRVVPTHSLCADPQGLCDSRLGTRQQAD